MKENGLDVLNKIFSVTYKSEDDLHKYMKANKTDCALKIFLAEEKIEYPEYIKRAIV